MNESTNHELTNRQVRLAKRPDTNVSREHWNFTTEPVADPGDGGLVIKTLLLSLDPAMRGWLNDAKSYIAPVAIGEVMRAGGIGRVVASRHPAFAVGDAVSGSLGVQAYCPIRADELARAALTPVDLDIGSMGQWLNTLGMPGMTAYFGLKDVGQPKPGETLVISAAAGAVGQTAGQLGRILGCRVVGIAGGPEKCDWVVRGLGFEACIDYRNGPDAVRDGLKRHCPKGVDIYFDNVGGEILDAVLARLARKARVIICGAISQYNNAQSKPAAGPRNYLSLLVNRARMEGIVVFDFADRFPQAVQELSRYLQDGRLKSREHVVEGGIDAFPEALQQLFAGTNFGKLVLRVGE